MQVESTITGEDEEEKEKKEKKQKKECPQLFQEKCQKTNLTSEKPRCNCLSPVQTGLAKKTTPGLRGLGYRGAACSDDLMGVSRDHQQWLEASEES